jgi:DNA-binding NtrC family response regulator
MKNDLNNLRQLVSEMAGSENFHQVKRDNPGLIKRIIGDGEAIAETPAELYRPAKPREELYTGFEDDNVATIDVENLSLQDKELEMIRKSLERNQGRRKNAASELGISERTLYRKIKQYNL